MNNKCTTTHYDYSKFSRSNIWLFNSADQFSGNVKHLFLYICKNHPEIFACYISESEKTAQDIVSLGYRACSFKSDFAKDLMLKTGVYVNENAKEFYPAELSHTKILNLFHGVGLKEIERCWKRDFLGLKIAKKYIRYNEIFRKNMCFLVTSEFMEAHFTKQLDLRPEQLIRAGYPRCPVRHEYRAPTTYDASLYIGSALQQGMKIGVYAPTYRESNPKNFLHKAVKDIFSLLEVLKKNNILLIIKLHPKVTNDFYFKKLSTIASNSDNLLLWDNTLDIYEIFDKIYFSIIDYSSIYYDLLAAGVKHFIRYIFDYSDESKFLIYDYFENTTGKICYTFNALLEVLNALDFEDDDNKTQSIIKKFWSYSGENDFEKIIQQTKNFTQITNLPLSNLHSFDIFDTLITRKVLKPCGIFYYVMERIVKSNVDFPEIFKFDYPHIRMNAESNAREYVRKNIGLYEISFDSIFERISSVFDLTEHQIELLKEWEIEAELNNILPIEENIQKAESLIHDGESVVLISDMYLDKKIITKMIESVSPKISKVPIFLSSDVKVQKTTQKLYLDVYRSFNSYTFKQWIHYGDNSFADESMALSIGIHPEIHTVPTFNDFEQGFVDFYNCYDIYQVAGMIARFRFYNKLNSKEYYAFAHIGLCFYPYISWAVQHAVKNNIRTLYFISRDGYFLKKIADSYISKYNIDIKTKYIYGSRRAWRLPAMIDDIDEEFFSNFGNFVGVDSYSKLLDSLSISESRFQTLFPDLNFDQSTIFTKKDLDSLRSFFKNSAKFKNYILEKAAEIRPIVIDYLKQEICFSEKFAFVEFWGRGYTQTLFGRLLDIAAGKEIDNIYYYFRSILPHEGRNIRHNFTTNSSGLIFCEAIFANHPLQTVKSYKRADDKIVQVMDKEEFDTELFLAMERYLPVFCELFSKMNFLKEKDTIERFCADFSLYWFNKHQDDPTIVDSLAHLKDSVELWGDVREFAPEFTSDTLIQIANGRPISTLTKSLTMSLARSSEEIRSEYAVLEAEKKNKQAKDSTRHKSLKEEKLLLKLQKHPKKFFRDSKNPILKILSRICFTKLTKNILGKPLIQYTTNKLLLKKALHSISTDD